MKRTIDTRVLMCANPRRIGKGQAFPQRFITELNKIYPLEEKKVLWMFAGNVKDNPEYIKLGRNDDLNDIRPETGANIVCSFMDIPENKKYDMIIADPPYNELFAKEWKTDLPKPRHIILKSARLLKPGGILLLLHIIVVPTYRKETGFERIGLHPVLCGLGNAIRVLNALQLKEIKYKQDEVTCEAKREIKNANGIF